MMRSSLRSRLLQRPTLALLAIAIGGCAVAPLDDTSDAVEKPPPPRAHVDPGLVDVEPELVRMDEPHYPDAAREAGEQGLVLFDLLVDETGHVRELRVTRSASPLLDEAATTAVKSARFEPARRGDRPVATWLHDIPIDFKLHP